LAASFWRFAGLAWPLDFPVIEYRVLFLSAKNLHLSTPLPRLPVWPRPRLAIFVKCARCTLLQQKPHPSSWQVAARQGATEGPQGRRSQGRRAFLCVQSWTSQVPSATSNKTLASSALLTLFILSSSLLLFLCCAQPGKEERNKFRSACFNRSPRRLPRASIRLGCRISPSHLPR
jgi:hypothetical protein